MEITIEFAAIVKELVKKEDRIRFPNSVFWFKDGKVVFEYIENKNVIWCSYPLVWLKFEGKFGMSDDEVMSFISDMADKHFNYKKVKTSIDMIGINFSWAEEHFNDVIQCPNNMLTTKL